MKIKTVFNYVSLILETNLIFRRPGWPGWGLGSLSDLPASNPFFSPPYLLVLWSSVI